MPSFTAFEAWRRVEGRRLVLATTRGAVAYTDFAFTGTDVILLGRESAGAPDAVHEVAEARIVIPARHAGTRSLNVALAGAMISDRQLGRGAPGSRKHESQAGSLGR